MAEGFMQASYVHSNVLLFEAARKTRPGPRGTILHRTKLGNEQPTEHMNGNAYMWGGQDYIPCNVTLVVVQTFT